MRLLLLDQFSDPGGAQQALTELLPELRRREWQAMVGLPGSGPMFEKVREAGFEARQIECGPYTSGRKSIADMGRFVAGTPKLADQIGQMEDEFGPDLIYVNGPRLLPAVALMKPRVPVVFHSHSYLSPGMVRRLAGRSLRRCDAWLIGSCEFVAEPWREYVPPGRVRVVYNGVAGPAEAPVKRERRGPYSVAMIGRIAPEKRQLDFVEAALAIRGALPDCRFGIWGAALFGEAEALRYEEEVKALGAKAGVEFHGWVSDVYAALESIDLLLVPSAGHEATTRVILEAFAMGVPVIAYRSGGIPEVVDQGLDGWLADSAGEMAKMAIEVLSDPARLAAASEAARESWEKRFALARYHEQLLETLETIKA